MHDPLCPRGHCRTHHDVIGIDVRVDDVHARQDFEIADIKFRVHGVMHGRFLNEIVATARDVTQKTGFRCFKGSQTCRIRFGAVSCPVDFVI